MFRDCTKKEKDLQLRIDRLVDQRTIYEDQLRSLNKNIETEREEHKLKFMTLDRAYHNLQEEFKLVRALQISKPKINVIEIEKK